MEVMQLLSLRSSTGWFVPFQMVTLSCRRNFSRSDTIGLIHIYWRSAIHTMPLSLELLQCVLAKPSMQSRSPINLRSNYSCNPHSARISHANTHLDMTIALLESLSAKVVWKEDIGRSRVPLARTANPLFQWTTNQKVHMFDVEGRSGRLTL